ncbi:MBL fold metallo-hydrolase [soil metagenome]
MKIGFYGAAGTVTGSKHLLTLQNGKKILLDCGMFQGRGNDTEVLNRHWGFQPHEVDVLILSHAHIDHSGLIPKLVKDGFQGLIYCTPSTADLCDIMLNDSASIQESEVAYVNKRLARKGRKLIVPLYSTPDAERCLKQFRTIPYNTPTEVIEEVEVTFTDAGHILGSAAVNLRIKEGDKTIRLTFSGDIGKYGSRILRDPQPFPQADYIICESTYGDRLHDTFGSVEKELQRIVEETCVIKGGKLIIPAFSVGRTQEVVNVLNNLEFEKKLPHIPVYVDSPMAVDATEIMQNHPECFNEELREYMDKDPSPFGFDRLHYIRDVQDSIALNTMKGPAIIISASGMAEAGRIKHHIKNNIEDARNTILIVGWATPSSLAGRLRNGEKHVSIYGEMYDVNADVAIMDPFSAHGDYKEMLQFLSCQNPAEVKRVFLVHGDPTVMPAWKGHLMAAGFHNLTIAEYQHVYEVL